MRNQLISPLVSQKGTTIIEAVVAIGLTAIILTAVLSMISSAFSATVSSKQRTLATRYAEEGQEVARSLRDKNTFFRIETNSFFTTYVGKTFYVSNNDLVVCPPVNSVPTCPVIPGTNLTRSVAITDVSNPAGSRNMAQIEVKVTWPGRGANGKEQVITDSYLSQWFSITDE